MVWAWSRSALLEDEGPAGARPPAPRRVLPESVFRGQPLAEGEELVRMHAGVEGRVWRNHALVGSEWWPEAPDLGEWNRFRRGAGLPPVAVLPPVLDAPLMAQPWSQRRSRAGVSDLASRYGGHALVAAVALGAAVLAAPAASALRFWWAANQVQAEMTRMDAGMTRILDARDAALRDAGAIQDLLALRPPAGQIELLAAATTLFPSGDWQILEWDMADASSLELEARVPQADPASLARAWEASELFEKVTVELGQAPDTVRIRAGIVRRPSGASR